METQKQNTKDIRIWLAEELTSRQIQNPAYSLRAFARGLGLSAATTSQLMSGKRPLTRKTAQRIAQHVHFSPETQASMFGAWSTPVSPPNSSARLDRAEFIQLQTDQFRLISDWYHYAILSLGSLTPNKSDPSWISERLGISRAQAIAAFDRLRRMDLITEVDGSFAQTSRPMTTTHDVSETAIRKYHHQIIEKAKLSIDEIPVQHRDVSAITMAIDPDRLVEAKRLIKDFRRKLCKVLETGNPKRVYTLAIQLFPLSKE